MDGGKSRAVNEPFGKATTAVDLVSVMETEQGGGGLSSSPNLMCTRPSSAVGAVGS